MSYILDILMQKKDINKLNQINLNEVLVEWNGKLYSQEPKKYQYGLETVFLCYSTMDMNYYRKKIDKKDNINRYIALNLKSDVLLKLHRTLYINDFDNSDSELVHLINDLYHVLDKFYIILLRDE